MYTGYKIENDVLILEKEMNEMDILVKKFLDIAKKYFDYIVVSGYISIISGRTRGTEDIDIILKITSKTEFKKLFNDLMKDGFWCYQAKTPEEAYEYIKNKDRIRFATNGHIFPNIEVIPFDETKKSIQLEFDNPQKVKFDNFELKIPPLEFEIAYKEVKLKSPKDLEDAAHIKSVFKKILDENKINEIKRMLESE